MADTCDFYTDVNGPLCGAPAYEHVMQGDRLMYTRCLEHKDEPFQYPPAQAKAETAIAETIRGFTDDSKRDVP